MNPSFLAAVLAIGWVAMTGGLSFANFVAGLAVACCVLFILRAQLAGRAGPARIVAVVGLGGIFVRELVLSALGVARLVLTPSLATRLKPAIIAHPLEAKSDREITLLANLITLTPGTLTVDVSPDKKRLFVHVLSLESEAKTIDAIKTGFERRVIEIFR